MRRRGWVAVAALTLMSAVACGQAQENVTNSAPSKTSGVATMTMRSAATSTPPPATPQTFDTLMRKQGFTADQIDTVNTYRQSACTTLKDNPILRGNWNASTVQSEIQDSYDIALDNTVVTAILKSCN